MSVSPEQSVVEAEAEPRAVIVADRDGVIRDWNPVAERIFGYSAVEAIGQTLDLVMPEEERADHWRNYRRVMTTNIMNYSPDHILDVEGMRQDGSRVPLDAMLKPTRDASGRITAITAILREVGIVVR
jgi:PAS domain S-box-containing protein